MRRVPVLRTAAALPLADVDAVVAVADAEDALNVAQGTDDKKSADEKKITGDKQATTPREPRERKQRGPPEDGVASKTKVMVANLPYDLKEDKVRIIQ